MRYARCARSPPPGNRPAGDSSPGPRSEDHTPPQRPPVGLEPLEGDLAEIHHLDFPTFAEPAVRTRTPGRGLLRIDTRASAASGVNRAPRG